MNDDGTLPLGPSRAEMIRAFGDRDAGYDGVFFVGVRTTGIFCRPSCSSRPLLENVEFLSTLRECLEAGYRPCKRCRPTEVAGAPPAWVADLMRQVEASPETRWRAEDLRRIGIAPERARRWFQEFHGMSFAAWCRAQRLAGAFQRIRSGAALEDTGLGAGFSSSSGFREAFSRAFGAPPGRARQGTDPIITLSIETPLGPLLAGAREEGLCFLEYTDRRPPGEEAARLQRVFGAPLVPGRTQLLERLRRDLDEYFRGRRRAFDTPLAPKGTEFQRRVWEELGRIPYGTTLSYGELARRLGHPTGQRAVAQANRTNRISILIPCHRVVGQDGSLTGYGGGLWRKRLLLELERSGVLPGDLRTDSEG